jgi:hypothetical protein
MNFYSFLIGVHNFVKFVYDLSRYVECYSTVDQILNVSLNIFQGHFLCILSIYYFWFITVVMCEYLK